MFVCVDRSRDGIGKLIAVSDGAAEVEYFASPAGPALHSERVPSARVRPVELSVQTRVYWFDEERGTWRMGRVTGAPVSAAALRKREEHYPVRFPNDSDVLVPRSQLYLRWSRPINDPLDYLAARITDTPLFYDGRARLVRHLASQRAAFGGLMGIASAAVELLEHQITTVRRILADPVQRYLLADEVGLGKTIQACALVRQHVIERPDDAKVLIIVPRHLVSQWRAELAEKFFLSEDDARISVIAEELLLDQSRDVIGTTMIVVDEAHRCAVRAFSSHARERADYDALRHLVRHVPRVLLLSGTPVLDHEDGFLAMLHLLDPDAYPLEDRSAFRLRVQGRQTVAEALADLGDEASDLFVEDALDQLEKLFVDDPRLLQLCGEVRRHLVASISNGGRARALQTLRTHVTETYRLHRRLLRTRRDDPRIRDHLPQRRGVTQIDGQDQARNEAFDFVETWRLALPSAHDAGDCRPEQSQLLAVWVEAALSHPRVLLRCIDARLALRARNRPPPLSMRRLEVLSAPWAFADEEALLRERRRLIADCTGDDARVSRLASWMHDNPAIRKVIVFVDDVEVAEQVSRSLGAMLGAAAVLRQHTTGAGSSFCEESTVRVLVCDASAEEGLNLQRVGAAVVHYDLPLEPTRIEQRIGRVDRIAAHGRLRNVIFSSTYPYEREWVAYLSESVRIFHRSVAPLQYVLLDSSARMRDRFVADGPAAIDAEAARLRDPGAGVDAELRRIRQQELIDSFEIDPDVHRVFFETLQRVDEAVDTEGRQAFDEWMVRCLQFNVRSDGDENPIRYAYSLHRPTLLPLLEVLDRFDRCLDREAGGTRSRSEVPLKPCTFVRAVAQDEGVGLMRIGHPLVDATESLVRADDRGAAFAMWRHVPGWSGAPALFFRFDFVVEADVSLARAVLAGTDSAPEALRRRADETFPVEYRSIWLDVMLAEVRDPRVLDHLERPYQALTKGGRDLNLRPDRWSAVDAAVPVTDWGELCVRARTAAERALRGTPGFVERCQTAAARVRVAGVAVEDQLHSRIARLSGAARASEEAAIELERQLIRALAAGVTTPLVRLDAVGAVYLASSVLHLEAP
ncbi:protein DpdE [Sorangium sp. So ce281]|uniref:protein DpdE n=1 Tax=unclassified Sorangium TaxID=2621164 RepID=UPI003F639E50